MSSATLDETVIRVHVENVGGITESEVAIPPGVTALVGENATNRTSLLQGLMAGLGSSTASLKGDSDAGYAKLSIDGSTYEQRGRRNGDTVTWTGDPYLEDAEAAELFAFLLESNEARRAVVGETDLREIIMRPVDTDEIEREIERLRSRRTEIEERLAALEDLEASRADLESERERLVGEIESTAADLADKRAALEDSESDAAVEQAEQDRLEERLEALRDANGALEDVTFEIETERESIDVLESELESVESELASMDEPESARDDLEDRIDEARREKRRIDGRLSDLQRLIKFNQEMLEGESSALANTLEDVHDRSADTVTAELVEGSTTVCWTCGTRVETDRIGGTVEALKDHRSTLLATQRELDAELDDLRSRRNELEDHQERFERLESKQSSLADELEDRRGTLETLQERRATLEDQVESLESEVDTLETETNEALLERHREANELEYELDKLRNERQRVESNLEEIDEALSTREDLEAERESVGTALTEARERVDRIERRAIDAFNDHMQNVLDVLGYDNISRIWLERRSEEAAGQTAGDRFDLHIVRKTDDGAVYEDSIDHLSESERRITGLVFAVAGYLTHEVYEELPVVILDSLEAIDAHRIAALIDYLREYVEYLVVALLPEDAQYLEDYERIETI